jgi:3-deoxy-7-phosphoheptulonate synthase
VGKRNDSLVLETSALTLAQPAGLPPSAEHVNAALEKIRKTRPDAFPSLMVDCSHGNSSKNHRNQPLVVDAICDQLESGQRGITGVMFESNLNEGKQSVPETLPEGVKDVREVLKRGVSITDACVDFEVSSLRFRGFKVDDRKDC